MYYALFVIQSSHENQDFSYHFGIFATAGTGDTGSLDGRAQR